MHPCDVSVVVPFHDDEEILGSAIRRVAAYLRDLDISFELLAVDADCRDNCHALLALIRPEFPELKIIHADTPQRGFASGASQALGRVLWLVEPQQAARAPLAAFADAYHAIVRAQSTVIIVADRFSVAHRTKGLPMVCNTSGFGREFQHELQKQVDRQHRDKGSRWRRGGNLLRLAVSGRSSALAMVASLLRVSS